MFFHTVHLEVSMFQHTGDEAGTEYKTRGVKQIQKTLDISTDGY